MPRSFPICLTRRQNGGLGATIHVINIHIYIYTHTYIYIYIHVYIYIYTYISIYNYIYIYIYFSTPGIQKMGKLTSFGVDMFFLNLLESKKWKNWLVLVLVLTCFFSTSWNPKNGKITSFGVDMFFSNSWSPKNGENWLVLVLTCFFLKLLVLTYFSQTRASQKIGKID